MTVIGDNDAPDMAGIASLAEHFSEECLELIGKIRHVPWVSARCNKRSSDIVHDALGGLLPPHH